MKDDFFKDLFETARETANDLLNKVERTLREVEEDLVPDKDEELETLRRANEALSERITELEEVADDFGAAIQLMLDGEVEKSFTMSWERYWNLRDSDIEVELADDTNENELTVTIRQER